MTTAIELLDNGYFAIGPRNWSEILPGLYQGGTRDDDVISTPGKPEVTNADFQFVVSAYPHSKPVGASYLCQDTDFVELRVPFPDSSMDRAPIKSIIYAAQQAHDAWKGGLQTLIRCQAGLNRSGLITALILVKSGYEVDEAIELIRAQRHSEALFNVHYVSWLRNNAVRHMRKASK